MTVAGADRMRYNESILKHCRRYVALIGRKNKDYADDNI